MWKLWTNHADVMQCDGDKPTAEAGRSADSKHTDEGGHEHRQVKHRSAAAGKLEPSTWQGNSAGWAPSTDAGHRAVVCVCGNVFVAVAESPGIAMIEQQWCRSNPSVMWRHWLGDGKGIRPVRLVGGDDLTE